MKLFIGCGSRNVLDQEARMVYQNLIQELAAIPSLELVLGGIETGLMKICHDAFKKQGKKVTVILDKIREEEQALCKSLGNTMIIVPSTMDRTRKCFEESDMALFLEGGMGTHTEIWSFLEEKRTYLRDYPMYIFNYHGVYDALFASFAASVQRGMMIESDVETGLIKEESASKIKERIAALQKERSNRK